MVVDHDDTDDVLQTTMIKVWKGLEKFREEASLYTWIYRIASNEALTFLNKKKKYSFFSIQDLPEELFSKLSSNSFFDGNQIELELQKAVLTLPDKQRLVFNMKYYEDLPYEQMSEILGTSVGALKASYHHAVKKVKNIVNEL